MWKNLGANVTGIVGAALENVQKISSDLEAQIDAAVAEDENGGKSISPIKPSESTPKKSQSSVDLGSGENISSDSVVTKASSEGALSSLSTENGSPSKTKSKKTKTSKKKNPPAKPETTVIEEEVKTSPEPLNVEDQLNSEIQRVKEEERLGLILLEQERLLKVQQEEEVAAEAAQLLKSQEEAKAIAEIARQKEQKAIEEEEEAARELARQAEIEAELLKSKQVADRVKAIEKAEQKKAREEAKEKKLAEVAERKAQEAVKQKELREQRKKEAAEKKQLAEEKAAADEEIRLELKKSQEIARQVALQEAKEAAALKKQAEDSKMELIKQQETNDSVSLQHALAIEKFESRLAEQEMQHIELKHKNEELTSLLDHARNESESKMEQMSTSFKLEEDEWKVNMTEALDRSKQEMEQRASEDSLALTALIDEQREKIEALEEENISIKEQLVKREEGFDSATKKVTNQLQSEIDKISEVVSDRERALQTSTLQMSELTTSYEDALSKITSLEQSVAQYKGELKDSTAASASTSELRKELAKLQEALQSKDESLAAFQVEGQALAKKQSDMEKNTRKSRQEVREKVIEINKLKETKEQYVKTIEEMQDVIRANENNSNSTQKHMSVMQAVSQASQDKLVSLESELAGKVDELGVQRKALESSWSEISDLKKIISELKAEKDDLQNQIGAGANKVVATESTRRDLEQREAILRATNKQLQDSLQRQMSETVAREERMREELNDTRKRWQEAVSSRESLASEVSGATTPLLRQISSLQESLRVKSEGWQKIESTLTERAIRAENIANTAEKKTHSFEDEIRELKITLKSDAKQYAELQHEMSDIDAMLQKTKRLENEANERIAKLQKSLNEETSLRISLENNTRDIDSRHRRTIQEIREEKDTELKQKDLQTGQLKSEIASLTNQLQELNVKSEYTSATVATNKTSDEAAGVKSRMNGSLQTKPAAFVAGSETSFAASERNNQQVVQRDEKIDHLLKQIQQIQLSRDALLDEVSFLSSKLSEYEELLESFPKVKKESKLMKNQNNALLLMLGEKEEVLESTLQDMKDMKELYKCEIKNLLNITDDEVNTMDASVTNPPPPSLNSD